MCRKIVYTLCLMILAPVILSAQELKARISVNTQAVGTPADKKAFQTLQAALPIYNTNYECPLINFLDENVTFKYVEYQPIEFNENRVSGSDPMVGNLPAILAYY